VVGAAQFKIFAGGFAKPSEPTAGGFAELSEPTDVFVISLLMHNKECCGYSRVQARVRVLRGWLDLASAIINHRNPSVPWLFLNILMDGT